MMVPNVEPKEETREAPTPRAHVVEAESDWDTELHERALNQSPGEVKLVPLYPDIFISKSI